MADRTPTSDKRNIPAKITANCSRAEKIRWIEAAKRAGTKLEPWVVRTLNEKAEQEEASGK